MHVEAQNIKELQLHLLVPNRRLVVAPILNFFAMSCFDDSVGENPNLCSSTSCTNEKTKKKNIVVPIVASVGGFILLLTAAAIFWIINRRNHGKGKINTMVTNKG